MKPIEPEMRKFARQRRSLPGGKSESARVALSVEEIRPKYVQVSKIEYDAREAVEREPRTHVEEAVEEEPK